MSEKLDYLPIFITSGFIFNGFDHFRKFGSLFQILISVIVLVVVGYLYGRIKNRNKRIVPGSREDELSTPEPTPSLSPPPTVDPSSSFHCPSCGAAMKLGEQLCQSCGYGMN